MTEKALLRHEDDAHGAFDGCLMPGWVEFTRFLIDSKGNEVVRVSVGRDVVGPGWVHADESRMAPLRRFDFDQRELARIPIDAEDGGTVMAAV